MAGPRPTRSINKWWAHTVEWGPWGRSTCDVDWAWSWWAGLVSIITFDWWRNYVKFSCKLLVLQSQYWESGNRPPTRLRLVQDPRRYSKDRFPPNYSPPFFWTSQNKMNTQKGKQLTCRSSTTEVVVEENYNFRGDSISDWSNLSCEVDCLDFLQIEQRMIDIFKKYEWIDFRQDDRVIFFLLVLTYFELLLTCLPLFLHCLYFQFRIRITVISKMLEFHFLK